MKLYTLTLGAGLLIGGLMVYYLRPPVIKTEVKEVVKTQTITKIKRIKQPDGTIITEIDKVKQEDKQKQTLKTEPTKKDWNVALYATNNQLYGISVQRRILADFYLYSSYQTNGQAGFGIGWSF